ncbi:MAG: hypothetical protein IJS08_18335 [Victivallales bacterium]|nr:hypothetical protein [Victivallales bacterium]
MKDRENKKCPFIYTRATGGVAPVGRKVHDSLRETTHIHVEAQGHGRCACQQCDFGACDGDCLTCDYHRTNDIVSLDAPISECEGSARIDVIPSDAPSIEEVVSDRDLLDRIFARLRELDPDADIIIRMWMADDKVSDRSIAKVLGRPQSTFAGQMKRYRAEFRRIRGF